MKSGEATEAERKLDTARAKRTPCSLFQLAAEGHLSVAVSGPLVADDLNLVIRAAIDGVGLAYMDEGKAEPHLASGSLVRVLDEWCQPFPGYFLYYPSRRQQPAALSALIDFLRM